MTEEILVAVLGFAGTLAGSLFGILTAQKLTQYRLAQLEERWAGTKISSSGPSAWRAAWTRPNTPSVT